MRKAAFLHSRGKSQRNYSELRCFLYPTSQLGVEVKSGLLQNTQRIIKGWPLKHQSKKTAIIQHFFQSINIKLEEQFIGLIDIVQS